MEKRLTAFLGLLLALSVGSEISGEQLQTWSIRKGGNDLYAVGFGNGTFVAVGNVGTILTSNDGRNWRNQIQRTGADLRGIAFGNGKFVAVGAGILSSTDGTNWSQSGATGSFKGIAYGNGNFVVVGDQGRILSSADGVTWTDRYSWTTNSLNGVAWGNGRMVVAGNGLILTSTDTIAWSSQAKTNLNLESATYGNGTFVIGGMEMAQYSSGVLLSSEDGIAWTNRFSTSTISYSPHNFWVAYGNGNFVGVGWPGNCACPLPDGGDHILTSTNGVNWTVVNSGFANGPYYTPAGLFGVGYGNDTFVAVGPVGAIALSTNGSAWEQISPDSYDDLYDVASGGQTFVAVGEHGAVYSSIGGDSWIRQGSPVTNNLNSVGYGNGAFVAVGDGGTIISTNGGKSWVGAASGPRGSGPKLIFQGGLFVTARGGAAFISSDGVNWSTTAIEQSNPFPPYEQLVEANEITSGNGLFLLAGHRGYVNGIGLYHWFGAVWTSSGQGWAVQTFNEGDLFNSCVYGNGRFLIKGTANITSGNGGSWSPWNPPWPPSAEVHKILFGNGTFLALEGAGPPSSGWGGGVFTSTNGLEWTVVQPQIAYRTFLGGCYGQGKFALVGRYGTIVQSADFISPQLEQPGFVGGQFAANVTGEVGRQYRVQASTNLAASNWVDLLAFTNSLPSRQFVDPSAANAPGRFYRVVSP